MASARPPATDALTLRRQREDALIASLAGTAQPMVRAAVKASRAQEDGHDPGVPLLQLRQALVRYFDRWFEEVEEERGPEVEPPEATAEVPSAAQPQAMLIEPVGAALSVAQVRAILADPEYRRLMREWAARPVGQRSEELYEAAARRAAEVAERAAAEASS